MNELKKKQRQIKDKKILNRDEVYHGALEDILLGRKCGNVFETLKYEPVYHFVNTRLYIILQSIFVPNTTFV